jgi:hypothetical protein
MIAALNYNENKVSQGKAICLGASGYLKDASEMNFYQKLQGLERHHDLNEAQTKTLHVSLNFSPEEKLSDEKLITIATDYMNRIGFGEQPLLVYKHLDAGHPHVHVVSSTIRSDGRRINTHNMGRNQSEKARKEIEKRYGLVRAENQSQLRKQKIQAVHAEKILYGKAETKKSITNVVNAIINTYQYASLPEFNAILKQYNVVADRGREDGRIFKHRGLVYRVLDGEGKKIGIPIKASSISSQPTLNKLEGLFLQNKEKSDTNKQHLKTAIDEALKQSPGSLQELVNQLDRKSIYTALRQNAEGRIYGITFVDNQHKTVFNGSDLGYSAGHLQGRLSGGKETLAKEQGPGSTDSKPNKKEIGKHFGKSSLGRIETPERHDPHSLKNTPLLEELLSAEKQQENIPFQLLK